MMGTEPRLMAFVKKRQMEFFERGMIGELGSYGWKREEDQEVSRGEFIDNLGEGLEVHCRITRVRDREKCKSLAAYV